MKAREGFEEGSLPRRKGPQRESQLLRARGASKRKTIPQGKKDVDNNNILRRESGPQWRGAPQKRLLGLQEQRHSRRKLGSGRKAWKERLVGTS